MKQPIEVSKDDRVSVALGVYDPASDHRRKGVYKQDIANLQSRNATLQTLINAILSYDETDLLELVKQMRTSTSLDDVAAQVAERQKEEERLKAEDSRSVYLERGNSTDAIENELTGKMERLKLDGSVKLIGGTSNLMHLSRELTDSEADDESIGNDDAVYDDHVTGWTEVLASRGFIIHLLNLYFTWHYGYFPVLHRQQFERDFFRGHVSQYCSPLLVNAILAMACHFSSLPGAYADPLDYNTLGDHFFKEAKRLVLENDEYERAKVCTVQALLIMSQREGGCGREGTGWVYSGMAFRMALDLGLNIEPSDVSSNMFTPEELDIRRITFWGCYLVDKYWSAYLGRQPQLTSTNLTVVMLSSNSEDEQCDPWSPYTDAGIIREELAQPPSTRTIAQFMVRSSEISDDLLTTFYHPALRDKVMSRQEQLRQFNRISKKLEGWRADLPREIQVGPSALPNVLLMHMHHKLLYIHLYRPFLKSSGSTHLLPSPALARKMCTEAATAITTIARIFDDTYGFQYMSGVAVYFIHSACTIHMMNLPEQQASQCLTAGLQCLEYMANHWRSARRALRIIDLSAVKWGVDLPAQADEVLQRTYTTYGSLGAFDRVRSPGGHRLVATDSVHQHSRESHVPTALVAPQPPWSAPTTPTRQYQPTTEEVDGLHQTPGLEAIGMPANMLMPLPASHTSEAAGERLETLQSASDFSFDACGAIRSVHRHTWTVSPAMSSSFRGHAEDGCAGSGGEPPLPTLPTPVSPAPCAAVSNDYGYYVFMSNQPAYTNQAGAQHKSHWDTPSGEAHSFAVATPADGVTALPTSHISRQEHEVSSDIIVKTEHPPSAPYLSDPQLPLPTYHEYGFHPAYLAKPLEPGDQMPNSPGAT
ncbi:hypothetical protein KEM52_005572 [Ascosphaera acerosa]|nr:hypothetical protein KEM52_005572 [Ascosphaera acerosa]